MSPENRKPLPPYQHELLQPVNQEQLIQIISSHLPPNPAYRIPYIADNDESYKTMRVALTGELLSLNSNEMWQFILSSRDTTDDPLLTELRIKNNMPIFYLAYASSVGILTGADRFSSTVALARQKKHAIHPLLEAISMAMESFPQHAHNKEDLISRITTVYGTLDQEGALAHAMQINNVQWFEEQDAFMDVLRGYGHLISQK